MAGLPAAMTRAPLRTFRPKDLEATYTQPSVQLHRLTRQGQVRRAAHGFYYAVPDDQFPEWKPTLEAVAAGIATAVFGERVPVLVHLSAARLHGALPRAVAKAVVAVPRQHAQIRLTDRDYGTITFVTRDVGGIDAALEQTDLGPVLVTTPEQTVLDLTKRPGLGGMPEECREAARVLLPRCDLERLEVLARAQRMVSTLGRLRDKDYWAEVARDHASAAERTPTSTSRKESDENRGREEPGADGLVDVTGPAGRAGPDRR